MATQVEIATAAQSSQAAEQLLQPASKPPKFNFSFSNFLLTEHRFGLDPDRPQCKAFLEGHCPRGSSCPDKHNSNSPFSNSLVCKHWMRGLCKKGEACEFLHEYNLRRMPECNNYMRHQTCINGDDCMYQHVDPSSKRPNCPHYDRGFCPLGPLCADKHVKRDRLCPFYLAGFCPEGKECTNGAHPRFETDLKKPEVVVQKSAEELEREREEREREARAAMMANVDDDGQRDPSERGAAGAQAKFGGRQWQGRKKRGVGGYKPRGRY